MKFDDAEETAALMIAAAPASIWSFLFVNAVYRNINSGSNTVGGWSGYGKRPKT